MIRAVDNKRLDLTDEEHEYYLKLVEKFGKKDFSQLFSTNKNGLITSITPPVDRQISLGVLFFTLNVMMNQRLRVLEKKAKKNIDISEAVASLVEQLEVVEQRLSLLESANGD